MKRRHPVDTDDDEEPKTAGTKRAKTEETDVDVLVRLGLLKHTSRRSSSSDNTAPAADDDNSIDLFVRGNCGWAVPDLDVRLAPLNREAKEAYWKCIIDNDRRVIQDGIQQPTSQPRLGLNGLGPIAEFLWARLAMNRHLLRLVHDYLPLLIPRLFLVVIASSYQVRTGCWPAPTVVSLTRGTLQKDLLSYMAAEATEYSQELDCPPLAGPDHQCIPKNGLGTGFFVMYQPHLDLEENVLPFTGIDMSFGRQDPRCLVRELIFSERRWLQNDLEWASFFEQPKSLEKKAAADADFREEFF